jgi:hypothetical protein
VVDHRLAPHFGRVRGQHRATSAWREQRHHGVVPDAVLLQLFERRGDVGMRLGLDALPILGEVGEHREEHEAADEIERLVEAQPIEPRIDRAGARDAAVAVDRSGADIFDALEQLLAAIGADHVAEQLAEEADVGILADRWTRHGMLLHRNNIEVNMIAALRPSRRSPFPFSTGRSGAISP